jgi:hypothetical protein
MAGRDRSEGNAVTLALTPFAWFHTILSLIAIVAGIVVLIGLFKSERLPGWTAVFILTAFGTSATGFGFVGPFGVSHWTGVIALIVLAVGILALYVRKLEGAWRAIYAVSAVLSLYFLIFVLIAQFFMKVPALNALAPTLSEPPFAIAQTANLALFIILMIAAARAFHPRPAGLAA